MSAQTKVSDFFYTDTPLKILFFEKIGFFEIFSYQLSAWLYFAPVFLTMLKARGTPPTLA
jgi:hypothetical protein